MGGSFFINFLVKCGFLAKSADPRFLHTVQRVGLIFKVLGLPKSRKNVKKRSLRNHRFLRDQKSGSKSVFYDFGVIFGFCFGAPEWSKIQEFRISLASVSGGPSGSFWDHFGLHFEQFWGHLDLIFGVFSEFLNDFPDFFEGCCDVCRFHWPALFL